MTDKIKINLGSGHWNLEGWVNVDLALDGRPQVCADLAAGLPFTSASADLMHNEDFIDQLDLDHARRFLFECRRVLKPGGVLRTLTPDLGKLAEIYVTQPERLVEMWSDQVEVSLQTGLAGEVLNLAMRAKGHSLFMYDHATFVHLLSECGFEARRQEFNKSDVPELRGCDLRGPHNSISMHYDCYRLP